MTKKLLIPLFIFFLAMSALALLAVLQFNQKQFKDFDQPDYSLQFRYPQSWSIETNKENLLFGDQEIYILKDELNKGDIQIIYTSIDYTNAQGGEYNCNFNTEQDTNQNKEYLFDIQDFPIYIDIKNDNSVFSDPSVLSIYRKSDSGFLRDIIVNDSYPNCEAIQIMYVLHSEGSTFDKGTLKTIMSSLHKK